jgi:hypothetical protein
VRTDRTFVYFKGLETDVAVLPEDQKSPDTIFAPLSPNLAKLRDVLITYTLYDFELGTHLVCNFRIRPRNE